VEGGRTARSTQRPDDLTYAVDATRSRNSCTAVTPWYGSRCWSSSEVAWVAGASWQRRAGDGAGLVWPPLVSQRGRQVQPRRSQVDPVPRVVQGDRLPRLTLGLLRPADGHPGRRRIQHAHRIREPEDARHPLAGRSAVELGLGQPQLLHERGPVAHACQGARLRGREHGRGSAPLPTSEVAGLRGDAQDVLGSGARPGTRHGEMGERPQGEPGVPRLHRPLAAEPVPALRRVEAAPEDLALGAEHRQPGADAVQTHLVAQPRQLAEERVGELVGVLHPGEMG
jgi:hypothetical protein